MHDRSQFDELHDIWTRKIVGGLGGFESLESTIEIGCLEPSPCLVNVRMPESEGRVSAHQYENDDAEKSSHLNSFASI